MAPVPPLITKGASKRGSAVQLDEHRIYSAK